MKSQGSPSGCNLNEEISIRFGGGQENMTAELLTHFGIVLLGDGLHMPLVQILQAVF